MRYIQGANLSCRKKIKQKYSPRLLEISVKPVRTPSTEIKVIGHERKIRK